MMLGESVGHSPLPRCGCGSKAAKRSGNAARRVGLVTPIDALRPIWTLQPSPIQLCLVLFYIRSRAFEHDRGSDGPADQTFCSTRCADVDGKKKGDTMARKGSDLQAIKAERTKVEAALEELMRREKEAEEALRDAGRPTLLSALGKIKIGDMGRDEAKAIAAAIAKHGGSKVAATLAGIGNAGGS